MAQVQSIETILDRLPEAKFWKEMQDYYFSQIQRFCENVKEALRKIKED